MRPTIAVIEEGNPFEGWEPHDYRLMEAVDTLDRDTCKTCGNAVWLCHTTHAGVQFEIMNTWCYGAAELDDYENLPTTEKPAPGENRYAKAVGIKNPDGSYDPLPSRAEALAKLSGDTLLSP